MSKAIKELERKKREEERRKLMQRVYEKPTPPYAPPRMPPMKGHSSNPISVEDVKQDIQKMIKDEQMAYEDYTSIAKALDMLGFRGFASGVTLIANDERRHKQTLENILRGIRK